MDTFRRLFPNEDDEFDGYGFSDLHKAVLGLAFHNSAEAINFRSLYWELNKVDSDGRTPLSWAAQKGDGAMVERLLENGADPNICDKDAKSALIYGAEGANVACIESLLQAGADTEQSDSKHCNALHYVATWSNNRNLIQLLVAAGVDANGKAIWGGTPLSRAALRDHADSARALLDCGADVNETDSSGKSLLNQCIFFGAKKLIRLLLDRGTSYKRLNLAGQSILHFAARHGDIEMLEVLRAASLEDIDPDALDCRGKSILQIAQERVDTRAKLVEKIQELLTDIRIRNASRGRADEDMNRSSANLRARVGEDWSTKILGSRLSAAFQRPLQMYAWIRSSTWHTWKTVFIYSILATGWAGFVYKLLDPDQAVEPAAKSPSASACNTEVYINGT